MHCIFVQQQKPLKMKKLLTLLLLTTALACNDPAGESATVKAISYNLRNSAADDGPNSWENRRHATGEMIRSERPDLFGVQEALADQLEYIDAECPQYARVGVGRDDGAAAGETMAVYYLTGRFELLDSGTFWLSETPDTVSRGWDGACNRTATWVRLRDKSSGKEFCFMNTHLDHMGEVARKEGIKLLTERVQAIADKRTPVVLGGDFNASIEDPIFAPLTKVMKLARKAAPEEQTDNRGTFNGFGTTPNNIVIDHLFVRGKTKCKSFRTLNGNYGAPYISDHYPIELVFTL